jgi:hypothetical protein
MVGVSTLPMTARFVGLPVQAAASGSATSSSVVLADWSTGYGRGGQRQLPWGDGRAAPAPTGGSGHGHRAHLGR